ncbi:N-acetylmuramic acid 6-phosphate etherase [Devosia sp. MC532]|uniref:N-acetylmuramic acid 6-phosphate etherase n=1 Tax=Devosia sp. MC532 TaxID=2799788 RepID=UPI0024A6A78D|nr:N-acetylmuramic acid 6-phosphate etherase [Devosia sp. MC532]
METAMPQPRTEQKNKNANALDLRSNAEILTLFADGQVAAAQCVSAAIPSIDAAATIVANTLHSGGRLISAAAGSSALMALADALELPGTFGIPQERIIVLFAGGSDMLRHLRGGPEDDATAGAAEAEALHLTDADCVIAISASGSTPYAVAAAQVAKSRGAQVIAIANNSDSPLGSLGDANIVLSTPPETIAGSTRMGAGTAQKIALNMISTLAALRLGHIYDGYMVNVVADNAKLVTRAQTMITEITGVSFPEAQAALDRAQLAVKPAILLAAGVPDLASAEALLNTHSGQLRPALRALAHP